MRNFNFPVISLLLFLSFCTTGCNDSGFFGGLVCTQIGCEDGLYIQISEERPDFLSLTIFLNEDTEPFSSIECTNSFQYCIIGIDGLTPETVSIEIKWKDGEFIRSYTPDYAKNQPNGPGCPPICTQASIEIELSDT